MRYLLLLLLLFSFWSHCYADAKYGSVKPSLDTAAEGSSLFTAPANSVSDHHFTFTKNNMFNEIFFYAWSPNKGDHIERFEVQYQAAPGLWYRYKKFAKNFNVYPNTLQRFEAIPGRPVAGMRILIKYHNTGSNAVDFSLNIGKYHDYETVNPMVGQQGDDW